MLHISHHTGEVLSLKLRCEVNDPSGKFGCFQWHEMQCAWLSTHLNSCFMMGEFPLADAVTSIFILFLKDQKLVQSSVRGPTDTHEVLSSAASLGPIIASDKSTWSLHRP